MELFTTIYNILWGDLIQIPLPGGSTLGLSLLVLILIPAGLYFTIRTRFLPFRLFPEMIRVTLENTGSSGREGISGVQALIISTACRVGMGNLVGVVAAISAGGAGAVFWMWVIALLGSSTAFIEATLAQLYKEKDPLYGGYRGGPAYYLHHLFIKPGSKRRRSVVASLFALSGLICWCGISQVTANSISSSFENAFQIPPLYSTIALVLLAAVIVLRKNTTVRRHRRRHHERRKTRALFQRGRFRLRSLCGCRSRHQPPGKGRPFAGPGSFYRHPCDLQLLRHDHAADAGKPHCRP